MDASSLNETWSHPAPRLTGIPRPLSAWFPPTTTSSTSPRALAVGVVYVVLDACAARLRRVLRAIRGRDGGRRGGQDGRALQGAGLRQLAPSLRPRGILFGHYLAYIEPNIPCPETLFGWLALILGGSGNNRGAIAGAVLLLGLLEGSRFAKDLIPFLTGVRLAAAQQMLVGLLLVVLMIKRPEGLLPEVLGDGRATPAGALQADHHRHSRR